MEKKKVMFLSEGVLSSNISNMNVMNLFLCLFACDNASYNCFNVFAMFLMCVQVYNFPMQTVQKERVVVKLCGEWHVLAQH